MELGKLDSVWGNGKHCLGFSHECSEFSQSSYFLEFRVKNVFRIHVKYLEFFMY